MIFGFESPEMMYNPITISVGKIMSYPGDTIFRHMCPE